VFAVAFFLGFVLFCSLHVHESPKEKEMHRAGSVHELSTSCSLNAFQSMM
jgi:hypothetical protein